MRKLSLFSCVMLLTLGMAGKKSESAPITLDLYASQQGYTDISKWDPTVSWGTVTLNLESGIASYDIQVNGDSVEAVYGQQEFYILAFSFVTDLDLTATTFNILPDDSWTVGINAEGTGTWAAYVAKPDRVRTVGPFDSLHVEISDLPLSATGGNFLMNSELIEAVYGWDTPWEVTLGFENNNDPVGLPNTHRLYSGTYDPPHHDPVPEPSTMILFGSGLIGLVVFRSKAKNSR